MKKKFDIKNPDHLLDAYRCSYFPMYDPMVDDIIWLSPNPRAIIPLSSFHVSRSLRKTIHKNIFTVTFNTSFLDVMKHCAVRKPQGHEFLSPEEIKERETMERWISDDFFVAYHTLHRMGYAQSVEIWKDSMLAGGLYGVTLGGAFFAESKFHIVRDASKVALYYLVCRLQEKKFSLLEVQFLTPHLASLGAIEVSKKKYMTLLSEALQEEHRLIF